jgi:hypothetical protein
MCSHHICKTTVTKYTELYFAISKTTLSLLCKKIHCNFFTLKKLITVAYENNDKKMESVYSKRIRAGKRRTYFFDVRETRGSDYYLTITESRKRFDSDGYDRHKIFLYKEDFNKFIKGLAEAVDYVKTELMPDFDFDAFNHDTPYEGEEGQANNDNVTTPLATEATATLETVSTPVAETLVEEASIEKIIATPVDNGRTEEVDKW